MLTIDRNNEYEENNWNVLFILHESDNVLKVFAEY